MSKYAFLIATALLIWFSREFCTNFSPLATFISALSEPFGAILAYLFLASVINDFIMSIILALIAGIMIHISIYELLKESFSYKNKKRTVLFLIIGFNFIILSHFLLG